MGGSGTPGVFPVWRWWLFVLCVQVSSTGTARAATFSTAFLNVSLTPPGSNRTVWRREEMGLYGIDSPILPVTGTLHLADPIHACANDTRFDRPSGTGHWIALIQRGNGCTFTQKISAAERSGASAAVIYNDLGTNNRVIQMSHPGTSIVAVMIGDNRGLELLQLLQQGVSISMTIEVGLQHGMWMSHYSILFISVSFFIITVATIGYFIFYLAQRLNNIRVQNQQQKQMKVKAKKAISQLQVRMLKHGDEETGPDADACAVCIESYKPGDVVSILTCNHFFHKLCIEPWLMEHRTCPMCKCDILKALGVEENDEEQCSPAVSSHLHLFPNDPESSHTPFTSSTHTDSESHTHTELELQTQNNAVSSGNEPEQPALTQHTHGGLEVVCVDGQPHSEKPAFDNPAFNDETCG